MSLTDTEASSCQGAAVTAPQRSDDRATRLPAWWAALTPTERVRVRESLEGHLPPDLVDGLRRAGVVLVPDAYFPSTQSGPAGFSVPADLAAFVELQAD